MLIAQSLYDYREESGMISRTELHDLFRAVCNGEPSPSRRTAIDPARLRAYADECRWLYDAHKANGGVGGQYLLDIAQFAEMFVA